MLVSDLLTRLDGIISHDIEQDAEPQRAVIDSRVVTPGAVFFALSGANADGNAFAQAALDDGAALAVMDSKEHYDKTEGNKALVKDVRQALDVLGQSLRRTFTGKVIAVTGSVGKTTTKELIGAVLRQSGHTFVAPGNFNNDLGVSVSLACLMQDFDYAVFELGSNAPGEITALSRRVRPDMAVVCSVGHAHAGRLGGIEGVAVEKFGITAGLAPQSVLWCQEHAASRAPFFGESIHMAVYGEGSECDLRLTERIRVEDGFAFTVEASGQKAALKVHHPYTHTVDNALAAVAVGLEYGLDFAAIGRGLGTFTAMEGRGRIISCGAITIIDDAYNAGFEAVMSAIVNLDDMPGSHKIAVIGEMAEIEGMERELHRTVLEEAALKHGISFIFVGKNYEQGITSPHMTIVKELEEAKNLIDDLNRGTVLLKASRRFGFDRLIESICSGKEAGGAV